ncbi:MAG: class I SAM-dependent methyltransferase [Polyangiales bacterium]
MTLLRAIERRESLHPALFHEPHTSALRLFNGFTEGDPSLSVELFARCAVLYDHSASPDGDPAKARAACEALCARFSWIECVLWKRRSAEEPSLRNGFLLRGERSQLPSHIEEGEGSLVKYAVDLMLNRDASFYVDAASLRAWLRRSCEGRSMLNTFAYTGSLGVAARAGGASRVVHVDRSAKFLALAKKSFALNGWAEPSRSDLIVDDFFRAVGRLKAQSLLFDDVIVDPPFFSHSDAGTVDLEAEPLRMLDKVQPLVAHGGRVVLVNNALFLSGERWMEAIRSRCAKGYLSVREVIDVDPCSRGWATETASAWPADPAPFAHPTKIVVLDVRRKDERRSNVR